MADKRGQTSGGCCCQSRLCGEDGHAGASPHAPKCPLPVGHSSDPHHPSPHPGTRNLDPRAVWAPELLPCSCPGAATTDYHGVSGPGTRHFHSPTALEASSPNSRCAGAGLLPSRGSEGEWVPGLVLDSGAFRQSLVSLASPSSLSCLSVKLSVHMPENITDATTLRLLGVRPTNVPRPRTGGGRKGC